MSQDSLFLSQDTGEDIWREMSPVINDLNLNSLFHNDFNNVACDSQAGADDIATVAEATVVGDHPLLPSFLTFSAAQSSAEPYLGPNNFSHAFLADDNNFVPAEASATNAEVTDMRVPANTNWPGDFDFNISFGPQAEKTSKGTHWTYSEQLGKLFVVKDEACPIRFHANVPPAGCIIRALPIFLKAEHILEIVKRCPNHSSPEDKSNQNHAPPEHLVRCGQSNNEEYEINPISKRLSVVTKYEPPGIGMEHTTYLFHFMCFGSCIGGLNRRPIQLVFTLEKDGKILGRRVIEVRICACPGRDRKAGEKEVSADQIHVPVDLMDLAKQPSTRGPKSKIGGVVSKKRKSNTSQLQPTQGNFQDGMHYVPVKKKMHYEYLMKMAEVLELADLHSPDVVANYRANQNQVLFNLGLSSQAMPLLGQPNDDYEVIPNQTRTQIHVKEETNLGN